MPDVPSNPVVKYLGETIRKVRASQGVDAGENISRLGTRLEFLRALVEGSAVTGIGTLFFVAKGESPSEKATNFIRNEGVEVIRVLGAVGMLEEAEYVQKLVEALGKAWGISPDGPRALQ